VLVPELLQVGANALPPRLLAQPGGLYGFSRDLARTLIFILIWFA
jgi:hypothetical protein